MESRIQFRINEDTKKLAQIAAERRGITISDACRRLTEDLADEQKEIEEHENWLQEEVNNAYIKLNSGKSEFYSNETAKSMMALRKKRIQNKR